MHLGFIFWERTGSYSARLGDGVIPEMDILSADCSTQSLHDWNCISFGNQVFAMLFNHEGFPL